MVIILRRSYGSRFCSDLLCLVGEVGSIQALYAHPADKGRLSSSHSQCVPCCFYVCSLEHVIHCLNLHIFTDSFYHVFTCQQCVHKLGRGRLLCWWAASNLANLMASRRVHKLVNLITGRGEWYLARAVID